MDYFKHAQLLKKNNPYRAWKIYEVVYQGTLKYYAKKIYGNRFEDALDMAYSHILENFNGDKGELEHYATVVIGTINLGMYKYEIDHEEVLEITADQTAYSENHGDPLDVILDGEAELQSSEVNECISYLLPFFIADYKFFKTRKAADRSLAYSELYNKFKAKTIYEAVNVILEKYDKPMEELIAIKKSLKFRNYSEDRYEKSMDSSVTFLNEVSGIILYKKEKGKMSKLLYSIDLQDTIYNCVKQFYTGKLNRNIGGLDVYCSLSGQIICDEDRLYETLENELVGGVLSKLQLMKVLKYERTKELVLVASKAISYNEITLKILGCPFRIPFILRTGKCIEC